MIYLHTLGDALIKVDEKEIRPTAPVMFAALLYLGVERGRRVPRAALQELLFPNSDERSGAHSLRQLLFKLRHLGAVIEADPISVLLPADRVQEESPAALPLTLTNGGAELAAKYSLGLLPGYEPSLSPQFREWLDRQRAATSASVRRRLIAALCATRETADWAAVERVARLILQLDPFNEEATLALAEGMALSGSKSEAISMLRQYERETGRSDLKLPASLLRRRISEHLPEHPRFRRTVPFLGREADFEAVRCEIGRARSGECRQLVISGEPGIGKSRLLEEISKIAALDGMEVHVVRCQSQQTIRPMGVFLDLVPNLLSSRGALGVAPDTLNYLNLLVSHQEERYDRPTDTRDDVSRSGVLFAAVRELIDAVAGEAPLLLAIDDIHWADAPSLKALGALSAPSPSRPLLVVLTTRSVDPGLRNSAIVESSTVRRLPPLSDDAMTQLAKHLLRGSVAEDGGDIERWCIRLAAGNPLFLHSLCAHYVTTGEPYAVPLDIKSLITNRLSQLPPRFHRVLQFCSLLGRHASMDAIRTLTASTVSELLDAFETLEGEGFLHLRDNVVSVSHSLLSDCALNMIPPLTRRLMHSSVATLLEELYGRTRDASLLWDCAEQWTMSGESEKASQFLRSCARHAADMGRAEQAIALLSEAKGLVRHPSEVADILGELISASKAAGQWVAVRDYARQLECLMIDSPVAHSDTELVTIEASWMMNFEAGDAPMRLLHCVEAQNASANHRFDAALLLEKIAHERGDTELAHRAYSAVEPLEGENHRFYSAVATPIIYHTSFGDRDKALLLAQNARAKLRDFEPLTSRLRLGLNLGIAFSFLGQPEDATPILEQVYHEAARLGMTAWQAEAGSVLCWLNEAIEQIGEASRWHQKVASLADRYAMNGALLRKQKAFACELALKQGDVETAAERFEELKQLGAAESVRHSAYFRSFPARMELLDPSSIPGDEMVADMQNLFKEVQSLSCFDWMAVVLGESLRRRGEHEKAAELIDDYVKRYRRERLPLLTDLVALRQVLANERVARTNAR